jgi:hypothetical protein
MKFEDISLSVDGKCCRMEFLKMLLSEEAMGVACELSGSTRLEAAPQKLRRL